MLLDSIGRSKKSDRIPQKKNAINISLLLLKLLAYSTNNAPRSRLWSRWTALMWPPMMQSILSSVNCSNCTIVLKWFRCIGTVHLWCHFHHSCAPAMTAEANAFHDAKCINISMIFCNFTFYRFRFFATVLKVAFVRLSQQCGLKITVKRNDSSCSNIGQ